MQELCTEAVRLDHKDIGNDAYRCMRSEGSFILGWVLVSVIVVDLSRVV